jgi:hypothetical protein
MILYFCRIAALCVPAFGSRQRSFGLELPNDGALVSFLDTDFYRFPLLSMEFCSYDTLSDRHRMHGRNLHIRRFR